MNEFDREVTPLSEHQAALMLLRIFSQDAESVAEERVAKATEMSNHKDRERWTAILKAVQNLARFRSDGQERLDTSQG